MWYWSQINGKTQNLELKVTFLWQKVKIIGPKVKTLMEQQSFEKIKSEICDLMSQFGDE